MLISKYFLMFIIYSFIGWAIEVAGAYYNERKFINRGFLIGPYCPIYGCGGVLITIGLTQYYNNTITLFVMAMVLCAILEYATSYILEKLFHARWWDYSKRKYNINGRICLETMVPFGLLGCFIIYMANPILYRFLDLFPVNVMNTIALIIAILFVIDILLSVKIISKFKKESKPFFNKDNTEEITRKVKEILDNATALINNRLVKAFPNIRKKVEENIESAKQWKEEMEKKTKPKNLIERIKKIFKKD